MLEKKRGLIREQKSILDHPNIYASNDWKRQTKSYISIYWTDRETENIGEMSP